jgi:prepilin-type N-terminal cleavage/methylation domain-containing protein
VEKRVPGFTLIELLTVIALLSLLLMFLTKLNFASNEGGQNLKLAAKTLAASLDTARSQAIVSNGDTAVFIDTSSPYKFRRIVLCRKDTAQNWIPEQIVLLPEKIFVATLSTLSNYLGQDFSDNPYIEEDFTVNGESVSGYSFIFNSGGILSNLAKNSTMIALGKGKKEGGDVHIGSDTPLIGVFILPHGQQIILESKEAMEGVL